MTIASKFKKPQSYRYIARRESWMPPALAKAMAYDPTFKGMEGTKRALIRCELFKAQATVRALMLVKKNDFRHGQLWEQPTK